MRNRFFLIILVVLTLVSASSVWIHSYILREEKIKQLDDQVREAASLILDSEIVELRRVDFNTVEKILADELGESRVGKFFVIRSSGDKVVYRSSNVTILSLDRIPQDPQWITLRIGKKYLRVLNLKLPKIPDRTLQVGIVVDEVLLDPFGLRKSNLVFFISMIAVGLLMAWVLTSTLLAPLRELEHYVSRVASQVTRMNALEKMPPKLSRALGKKGSRTKDEYYRLLGGIEVLIERMSRSYRSSRVWGYQMAHEIKTPLSILKLEIERAASKGALEASLGDAMQMELDRTTGIVSAFLEWAEMETTDQRAPLFVSSATEKVKELMQLFDRQYPNRIQLRVDEDFEIMANHHHLEQALMNVVSNALKYSPAESPVQIFIGGRRIEVEDLGDGVPDHVIERLGEPFNRGAREELSTGHGLGLAWVASVANLYSWNLSFKRNEARTQVSLLFGNNETETHSQRR